MATLKTITLILIISSFFFLKPHAEEIEFLHNICKGKEKIAKLQVYVHDLLSGNANPTVYEVASASITANSPTNFGSVHVVDDLVTSGPNIDSQAVGRIQGLTTKADMSVTGVALNLNFVFTTGKVNGSTISILGRNPITMPERELVVAGGTGVFRFARGYAIQTSVSYDPANDYGVYLYTIYTTYNSKITESDDDVVEIAVM